MINEQLTKNSDKMVLMDEITTGEKCNPFLVPLGWDTFTK